MSVGTVDLHKAIYAIWEASGLDTQFKAYWSTQNQAEFVALADTEAEPQQPFPYCIFDQQPTTTVCRMSGGVGKQEIRDVDWTFTVEARDMGDGRSAKATAALLAEAIMAVFGGHPTIKANVDKYALDNGQILISQYQTDFGTRTPTRENFSWVVKYIFRLDVPVA